MHPPMQLEQGSPPASLDSSREAYGIGVDALLDMARTSVNVLGNCLASAVVARWEGFKVG